ncbi:ABC transporter substrate-binding protein [Solwaraspora sp. WMMD406]|uniref:ABC transporter substrate-binding protein n=1 Tax=Solwaraspora sp. WMMD406 TaxID=3016095 RepID=UPI002415BA3A|nr:ABC transporter substrate-binding protein [Solwaraspora sp. WMMD406]MDG4766745.1 ABC transporter substrate-binding protein [Solwaraspora sp. WMMD406]
MIRTPGHPDRRRSTHGVTTRTARWRRARATLAATAALVLTACSAGESLETDEGADPQAGTLVVAISSEPDSLDVHVSTASPTFLVLENVYDTLVEPAPDLSFQPALATDWEVSDDLLTWTFHLRDGVTWHNGQPFVADDVVASFDRITDGETAANAWRFESVDEVRAVDDRTVEFVLNRPTPNLLANVGGFKGMAIVAPELLDGDGLTTDAIGTGPFRFVSYTPGDRIILEANPDYWGDGPHVDRVEFRFISEPTTALTNLRTGSVHLTNNVPPQEAGALRDDPDVELGQVASNDYWYFTCNFDRPPFDDIDVRRALSFAIDREQVAQAAFFDAATPVQSAMPPGNFWATDYAPFDYDPEQARELLAGAGVDGLTVDLMLTNEFPHTLQAAEVIASQWQDVGVEVEIRTLDFASWLDEQGAGSYDCYVLGWLNNLDGEYAYYAQHHSTGSFNFHGYADPQVDQLLDQARASVDDADRKPLYDQAARLIIDDVSYGYLYSPQASLAWLPTVEGVEMHPDGKTRLRTVRLTG